jgi:hypothetical protein
MFGLAIMVLGLALNLSACGKKEQLKRPDGSTYPRRYPPPAPPPPPAAVPTNPPSE